PPFGVDWKKIEQAIKDENSLKGFDGRFGPGLPRVSDGSLLFLLHLISKLRGAGGRSVAGDRKSGTTEAHLMGGARIGIILNGSPLFTGGAGSGESEIRRYILEADLLEAIVALPTDMFYNTGIATYVWILSNKKAEQRKGKVQLINGINLCGKMRKSLVSKRNLMDETDIATITRSFGDFETVTKELDKPAEQKSNRGRQSNNPKTEAPKTFASKIFNTYEFGYRRITIERPLRESYQFSDERIVELRFAPMPLNAVMKWTYAEYGTNWSDNEGCENYGVLSEHEEAIRKHIKNHFSELKEKQIKDLLDNKIWATQKQILLKAKQLQQSIGTAQHDDMNGYDAALKATGVKLDTKQKKQITNAVSWKNPDAEKVIKKIHKTKVNPLYGLFEVNGQVIEYKADGDLR
ncbi:MAG: N-6 DNA methylase, partial [Thiotrichaceae bacterium]|nr:N-6 DNA methylase [Thiotrichaceae bacterium]